MPKEPEPLSASRTYSLDLRDRIAGVWDEDVPDITHLVVEMLGVSSERLDKGELLEALSVLLERFDLISLANERLVVKFPGDPDGYTIVQVLAQSHIALHSWPQRGYLHVDLVACETPIDESALRQVAIRMFEPASIRVLKLMY